MRTVVNYVPNGFIDRAASASVSGSTDAESGLPINSNQQAGVKKMCKELKIDVMKYINMNGDTYKKLEEVSKNDAAKLLYKLNEYKRGEDDVREDILLGDNS